MSELVEPALDAELARLLAAAEGAPTDAADAAGASATAEGLWVAFAEAAAASAVAAAALAAAAAPATTAADDDDDTTSAVALSELPEAELGVAATILRTLGDAGRSADAREPMGAQPALVALVARGLVLSSSSSSSFGARRRVAGLAARAAGNMCFEQAENRERLRALGVVSNAAALLRGVVTARGAAAADLTADRVNEVVRSCGGALANMASQNSAVCAEASAAGVLGDLCIVIAAAEGGKVPSSAAAATGGAAAAGDAEDEASATSPLPLVRADTVSLVTRALCNVMDDAESRTRVLDGGAIAAFSGLLARVAAGGDEHGVQETLRRDAVTLLWNVLEKEAGEEGVARAVSEGGVELLGQLLRAAVVECFEEDPDDTDEAAVVFDALEDLLEEPGPVSAGLCQAGAANLLTRFASQHLQHAGERLRVPAARDPPAERELRKLVRLAVRELACLSLGEGDAFAAQHASVVAELPWLAQHVIAAAGVGGDDSDSDVDTELLLSAIMVATNLVNSPERAVTVARAYDGLIPALLRLATKHTDLRVHHGAIGCLRNLSVNKVLRKELEAAGWLDVLLHQLKKEDKPNVFVVFSTIAALRPLIGPVADAATATDTEQRSDAARAMKLLVEGGGGDALVELARGDRAVPDVDGDGDDKEKGGEGKPAGAGKAEDTGAPDADADADAAAAAAAGGEVKQQGPDLRIRYEAARILARLISVPADAPADAREAAAAVRARVARDDAAPSLALLLSAPFDVLQAEGLRALKDMAADPALAKQLAAQDDVLSAVRDLKPEGQQAAVLSELRTAVLELLEAAA